MPWRRSMAPRVLPENVDGATRIGEPCESYDQPRGARRTARFVAFHPTQRATGVLDCRKTCRKTTAIAKLGNRRLGPSACRRRDIRVDPEEVVRIVLCF